jgi:hypothetical protein
MFVPGPVFPTSYVVVFFLLGFNNLRKKVLVRFVHIDVIGDHHCFILICSFHIAGKLFVLSDIDVIGDHHCFI